MPTPNNPSKENPQWYKDAVIYQLHVKAFSDSNDDGIGDIPGLIKKLGYLKELGVTALWLLPFYPSPLKDDGYDIADYFNIHPQYGTLKDFKELVKEAHQHNLKIITELVLNHTSDQHPWFQKSRQSPPGSEWRNFYVWNDTPNKYQDARIIFKDFENSNWTWDPVAKAFYWHRFYSHQPDLNFENPLVAKQMFDVLDFWLDMGVDGLRLDAVPYLFEREDTNCENLPETHQFLKKLRAHLDEKYQDRMLLAEANQWPEDAVAYLGQGDSCHMIFHFPLMTRLFMALQREDSFPVIDILEQTPKIPDACQWATFLRNHDELTLEMVTDEERDYMYKFFARDPHARINLGIRRRLAPLLQSSRRKTELLNILLFSLPGSPIIYYGDEIGMGDNYFLGDRNGVRTPMQWSSSRNAGFSEANPHKLYLPVIIDPQYHYETVNVETQEQNLSSLLWWMRRVINMRKKYKAFSSGTLKFLTSDNGKVLAFIRQFENDNILVVINLSRYSQVANIDLADFSGMVPKEVFSQNKFPPVKDVPYLFTLGPYDHFWLSLRKRDDLLDENQKKQLPELHVSDWKRIFEDQKNELESILVDYLARSPWFPSGTRLVKDVRVSDQAILEEAGQTFFVLSLDVSYPEGAAENYLLSVGYRPKAQAKSLFEETAFAVIATVIGDQEGVLFDASFSEEFRSAWLEILRQEKRIKTEKGEIISYPTSELLQELQDNVDPSKSIRLKNDYNDTCFVYNRNVLVKKYHHVDEGIHPEVEMLQNLKELGGFQNMPSFRGTIQYLREDGEPKILSLAETYIPHESDAFKFVMENLKHFFEKALSKVDKGETEKFPSGFFDFDVALLPPGMREMIGGFEIEILRILGQRVAEMHLASASIGLRDFQPEAFSLLYQRSVYQNMNTLLKTVLQLVSRSAKKWPADWQEEADHLLKSADEIKNCFSKILQKKLLTIKIRIHGNFHLGQVLYTGKDFFFVDFKGDPSRPLSERRLRRSALRDIATMINSFHYAAYRALLYQSSLVPEKFSKLKLWADIWHAYTCAVWVHSYQQTIGESKIIPQDATERKELLQAYLLEKSIYDLGYKLLSAPERALIQLKVVNQQLNRIQEK